MLLAENLLQLIRGRRSVSPRKLSAPGPSDEQLSQMAAIIAAVPDHGRLSPARLVHIADRQALADLFVDALKELEPVADETALAANANGLVMLPACWPLSSASMKPMRPHRPMNNGYRRAPASRTSCCLLKR